MSEPRRAFARLFGRPSCGLRLLPHDPFVLLFALLGSWHWREALHPFAPLPAIVLAHFFLFCNVVRLRRCYELIWAASFVALFLLFAGAGPGGEPAWGMILALQAPVTAALVAAQFRSPDYHGVFAHRAPNALIRHPLHPRREDATAERKGETVMPETTLRETCPAETLRREHPPRFDHPNKVAVHEAGSPPGLPWAGTIELARFRARPILWVGREAETAVEVRPGFYDYVPAEDPATGMDWHVNFADPELFGYYAGALFAQDEMQTAEHPALGSLVEHFRDRGIRLRTVEPDGTPAPVLLSGVERRVRVRIDKDPSAGRPEGLYGNAFGRAPVEAVREAAEPIDPPTVTNLIAIAAPRPAPGTYDRLTISLALHAAHAGFSAARAETRRILGGGATTTVHSGFWGCGAFGGHRTLMIALQAVAARACGIDRLSLHAGDAAGCEDARAGIALAEILLPEGGASRTVADLIEDLYQLKFRAGRGDGN